MTKGLFALLLAGALVVPHVTPALGTDSTLGLGHAPAPQANGGDLEPSALPPSRHVALVGYGRSRPESRYPDGSQARHAWAIPAGAGNRASFRRQAGTVHTGSS